MSAPDLTAELPRGAQLVPGLGIADLPASTQGAIHRAVSPLEVAAALEASGLSDGVLRRNFGEQSLFAAARRLFATTSLHFAPERESTIWRPGRPADLARGIMFALPCALSVALTSSLRLHLPSWSLPMALVGGWSASQASAALLSSLRGASLPSGKAVTLLLVGSAALAAGLAFGASSLFGGGAIAVAAAGGLSLYVVLWAIALAHEEPSLLALSIGPSALVAVLYFALGRQHVPGAYVGGFAAFTAAATLAVALRHARVGRHLLDGISRIDLVRSIRHFFFGAASGIALAILIILATRHPVPGGWNGVIALPVLAGLGPMEWQVRTFVHRARRALASARTLSAFRRAARGALAVAGGWYSATVLVASVLTGLLLATRHHGVPVLVLAAEAALAAAYFLGLILALLERVGLVLVAWAGAAVIGLGFLAASYLTDRHLSDFELRLGFALSTGVLATTLAAFAWRAVAHPFSYR